MNCHTEGATIYSSDNGEVIGQAAYLFLCLVILISLIGKVTSGIPSPTLGQNISMGYVKSGWHKKGTELQVEVRKQLRKAVVTPMPFVKPKYWRG